MKKQLYSFDIFDTLITRKTASPEGVWALMQKRLQEDENYAEYPDRLRYNFYTLRIQAEEVARYSYTTEKIKDITIPKIYECIGLIGQLNAEQTEELMELELSMEMENCIPIHENIEKVHTLMHRGERVVLISNMYLRECDIRNLLVPFDECFRDIPIYISGEVGKTKGTRALYHYVREQEQVAFADWFHTGDNLLLDVEVPGSMGMQSQHFKAAALGQWEREIFREKESNSDLQVLLGVSKGLAKKSSIPYTVGAEYSVELLLPYVLWVIEESLQKGIRKLFFVARDGYILKKIADILIKVYHYPLETSYLYGSRKAWRLPSIQHDSFDVQEMFRWSFSGYIYSYDRIAEILGLTKEELGQFLPFMREGQLTRPLVLECIEHLKMQQKEIAAFICEKYQDKKQAAMSYLQQELGSDNQEIAFVELIGSGYTQMCLADLVSSFYDKPIQTFYYRLDYSRSYERNINYAFFPNRIKMSSMIEVLCGAPHGQTEGYVCQDGKWVPKLGEDEGSMLEAYGFNDYLSGIEDYVQLFTKYYPDKPYEFRDLSVAALYFDYMAEAKNQELYDYIADMPYGITGQEKNITSFAPRLTNKMLGQIYFWHKGEPTKKFYSGYSMEYSLMRLTERQKKRLEFYKKHGDDRIVKWLRKHVIRSGENLLSSRYDLIADRIVLYGAGKKGQQLREKLTRGKKPHAQIAMWVDKNYEKCRAEGLEVQAPEAILHTEYKQIVIAVANKNVVEEIKTELIRMGISQAKMMWYV